MYIKAYVVWNLVQMNPSQIVAQNKSVFDGMGAYLICQMPFHKKLNFSHYSSTSGSDEIIQVFVKITIFPVFRSS